MRTRTLTGLSATLLTAGIATAGTGLHPAVPAVPTAIAGALLVTAAVPLLALAGIRHAADRYAAAFNAGYRCGLHDVTSGYLRGPQ